MFRWTKIENFRQFVEYFHHISELLKDFLMVEYNFSCRISWWISPVNYAPGFCLQLTTFCEWEICFHSQHIYLTTFSANQAFVIKFFPILTSQGVIKSPTALPIWFPKLWKMEGLFLYGKVPSTYFHIKGNIFSLLINFQFSNHNEILPLQYW